MATVDGATLIARHDVPDQHATVYEIGFPRKLTRGEHIAFASSSTFTGLPILPAGEVDFAGRVNHCSSGVLTLEVVFSGWAPGTVWEFESPILAADGHRRLRAHQVDSDGRVHLVRRHAAPAIYGLEWITPETAANGSEWTYRHDGPRAHPGGA